MFNITTLLKVWPTQNDLEGLRAALAGQGFHFEKIDNDSDLPRLEPGLDGLCKLTARIAADDPEHEKDLIRCHNCVVSMLLGTIDGSISACTLQADTITQNGKPFVDPEPGTAKAVHLSPPIAVPIDVVLKQCCDLLDVAIKSADHKAEFDIEITDEGTGETIFEDTILATDEILAVTCAMWIMRQKGPAFPGTIVVAVNGYRTIS